MATNTQLTDSLARVREGVTQGLDRVGGLLPEQKQPRNSPPTFEDYHAQATAHMQAHPEDEAFRTSFEGALAQYRAAGKG